MGGFAILIVVAAAYSNTLRVPFRFDDIGSIVGNPSIRTLWPPDFLFHRPENGALTVAGRPILALSLAFNYALGGLRVEGYHVANLVIHVGAALALFGVARRTLLLQQVDPLKAAQIGLFVALVWAVHPLQTEAVTYIVQRSESLMGLCFLLTLYCFIRGCLGHPQWLIGAVVCCALGMATKEVAAVLPVVVLLYDRAFLTGDGVASLRRRWPCYVGMAGCWLLLTLLVLTAHGRGGSVGAGHGISSWNYLLTQSKAIVGYLRLAIWPSPLVFDYGTRVAHGISEVWSQALGMTALVIAAGWACIYRPRLGFLGAGFLLVLAPSSSVIPVVTQTIAEHRMYIPLAFMVAIGGLGLNQICGRWFPWIMALLVGILSIVTWTRNQTYRSDLALWSDTVRKCPLNSRAHDNLGVALDQAGDLAGAETEYQKAVDLDPASAEAHHNLGLAKQRLPGNEQAALREFETAVELQPRYARARFDLAALHYNLARQFAETLSSLPQAVQHYRSALAISPDDAAMHMDFGVVLSRLPGRLDEAIAEESEAIRLKPGFAPAHVNLAVMLSHTAGGRTQALREFETALRYDPNDAKARFNLANALSASPGGEQAAIAQYKMVLKLQPDFAPARNNLAVALAKAGNLPEAIQEEEQALKIDPNYWDARANLKEFLQLQHR